MSDEVICPHCVANGQASTVEPHGTSSTLIAFSAGHYDESGEWVRHRDPNARATVYSCSRGHRFSVIRKDGEPDRVSPTPQEVAAALGRLAESLKPHLPPEK